MDFANLTVTFGDPANVALRWALAALILAIGWLVVSFVFLPGHYGIKALVNGIVEHVSRAVRWLFVRAELQVTGIQAAYGSIALQDNLKSILVDQVDRLRQTARTAAKSVNAALFQFRSRGAGGPGATLKRLDLELLRLAGVQTVGEPHENAYRHRGMALLRAVLFTIFALALMIVNTALLNEFFRSLIRVQFDVFGVIVSAALIVSLLYTLVEFALGLALEVFNERENETGGKISPAAAIVFLLIITAILVEVGLYAILSFSIHWPWPASVRETMPAWADGWLALMGLLIGGGVAISGYLVGDQWSKVVRFSAYKSMAKQSRVLNAALSEFKGSIPELRRKAGLDATSSDPTEETSRPSRSATRAEENAAAVVNALEQVQTADISAMASCSPGDANWRRSISLVLLGLAALFVGGNILLQTDFLRTTALGRVGPWAPYIFAAIMAFAMMLFGWLGATKLQATRIGRGGDQNSERFEVRDHGLGVTQVAGLVGAGLVTTFGVSLACNGFRSFDVILVLASVGLNLASFAMGAMAESISSGIVFLIRAAWNVAFGMLYSIFGILTGCAWLLLRVLEVVSGVIAAPALWIISTFRRSKPAATPTYAQATA